jgi:hypothetical protein
MEYRFKFLSNSKWQKYQKGKKPSAQLYIFILTKTFLRIRVTLKTIIPAFSFVLFLVLEIEPRACCMQGKHNMTELHSQPKIKHPEVQLIKIIIKSPHVAEKN